MLERGTENALTVRLWRGKMQHHGITANAMVIVEVFIVVYYIDMMFNVHDTLIIVLMSGSVSQARLKIIFVQPLMIIGTPLLLHLI